MDAVEGYILTYAEGVHAGKRVGNVLYSTEGQAKAARTNMWGYGHGRSRHERASHAATQAHIVPLFRELNI